jgi:raffinose/stachyose/melibiose transport system permease protein/N-acetylglucosamine transport system permease protein
MTMAGVQLRHRRRPMRPGRMFNVVVLSFWAMSSIGAFAWAFMLSLKSEQEFYSTKPWSIPLHPNFHAYHVAWSIGQFGSFFLNSVIVTGVSVVASVGFASLASYVLGRIEFRGRGLVSALFLSGMMLPPFLLAIPLYFLLEDLHLLGTIWALVVVETAAALPFNIYVLTGYFRTLPYDFEEAAAIDGASSLRTFLSIMLPLARPALTSLGILQTVFIWNDLFYPLVFTTNEQNSTIPLGLLRLSFNAEKGGGYTTLFAGLIITVVPVLLLFAVAQDRIIRGLTAGAVKG